MSNWKITLVPPTGEEVVVHPEKDATHGVYLAEDQVKGDIIDAPVKTEWDSLAQQEGGTQRGVDWEYRDFDFGFHVTDNAMSAEEADSILRMLFDYEEDEWDPNPNRQTRIDFEVVGGPFAGSLRHIDVLMYDTPEVDFKRDMFMDQYMGPLYHFRAGRPMWYTLDKGKPYKTTEFHWTGTGTIDGTIEVENKTDRAMRHSWVTTAGVGTKIFLPDVSWVGKRGAREIAGPDPTRRIQMPTVGAAGGHRATLEKGKVMVEDKRGSNAMAQLPVQGKPFLYRIPPYTRKTQLPIHIEGAVSGGGLVELRAPQYWSRPYGLEMW